MGFCTLEEISCQLERKPELRQCVGERHAVALASAAGALESTQRAALRGAFTALMTSSSDVYQRCSQQLEARLSAAEPRERSDKDSLFLRVCSQFPGDVGTLAVFFLNYIQAHPGEAVYLAANEPHAYLSGELIEAMASSDNVIRAGLTPKLRDTGVRATLSHVNSCVDFELGTASSMQVSVASACCPAISHCQV